MGNESNGDDDYTRQDSDWKNRILCSDESCIGVIGPDGFCKECGKAFDQDQQAEEPLDRSDMETASEADMEDEENEDFPDDDEDFQEDPDWEDRTLCSDEACIGVIGPDGRCKECGKLPD